MEVTAGPGPGRTIEPRSGMAVYCTVALLCPGPHSLGHTRHYQSIKALLTSKPRCASESQHSLGISCAGCFLLNGSRQRQEPWPGFRLHKEGASLSNLFA